MYVTSLISDYLLLLLQHLFGVHTMHLYYPPFPGHTDKDNSNDGSVALLIFWFNTSWHTRWSQNPTIKFLLIFIVNWLVGKNGMTNICVWAVVCVDTMFRVMSVKLLCCTCVMQTPLFWACLAQPSKLHGFLLAPCVLQSPPLIAPLAHPLWLHCFLVALCVTHTPPLLVPFVPYIPWSCIFSPRHHV